MSIKIKGYVKIKLVDRFGKVLHKDEGENLVVTTGKDLIVDIVDASPGPARPGWGAIGDGPAAALLTDTALIGSEIARVAFSSSVQIGGNSLRYTFTQANTSGSSWSVKEMGIFNASSAGVMLARWIPTPFVVQNLENVEVVWTLAYG